MRMVEKIWSEGLDPLQHRRRVTSKDGGEPELYIQGKDSSVPAGQSWLTACQQQSQTSAAGQRRTDRWGRAEQAGVGTGEANAVATPTSSLLPSFLPGPASKASLPVIAYYFSPEAHLRSHPLVQQCCFHPRGQCSAPSEACFAAPYRQSPALFLPEASLATKSIPTK